MARWIRAIYEHRDKTLPFLAVIISGVRNQKVEFAAPAKTRAGAEAILAEKWNELASGKSPATIALMRRYGVPLNERQKNAHGT
jgi:hypothetical protein